jgi:galactitol-specific phosphotransferase system IIB component
MSVRKVKKKIMLVCGSGIVSSTLVMPVIEEILEEILRGNYELIKGRIHEVPGRLKDLDLILTTVPLTPDIQKAGVPIVTVTGLFAGKKEEIKQKIIEALKII